MIGYLSRRGEGVGKLLWREREDFFFFSQKKIKNAWLQIMPYIQPNSCLACDQTS